MSVDAPTRRPLGAVRTLLRLLPWARPALPRLILGAVSALIASVVALLIPQVLRALVDGPLQSGVPSQIWIACGLVLGLGVLEAVMVALRRFLVLNPASNVEASLRNSLYAHLQRLPVAFHDKWAGGQLLSRSMSDLGLVRRYLAFGIVLLVVNTITITLGILILILTNVWLGLLFLACAVPVVIMAFRFERRYDLVARRSQDQQGDLATAVEESVHGIRVLKAFGRGPQALRDFASQAEQLRGTELEKANAVAGLWLWLILIPEVAYALCLLLGGFLVAGEQLSLGSLFAFFATSVVLRFPIESVGFLLSMTLDTKNAVNRFFEVMDEPNPITDPEHPKRITDPKGELVFDKVTFAYPDAPEDRPPLLDGVDLTVHPGESMALVGLTGSGKTTLTALVPRLYDVTGGSIRIDGVDVRDLTLGDLRTHVGMAFEEPTLFSETVRSNVLMGRPDAGDAALEQALRVAQASFVYDLPDGLDTVIGEEGLSLSGGQRQRLALARVIAANPIILVLDDPLSALDVGTEALVEEALRDVMRHTTSLIVAHRPSTVQLADRVALLQHGRIVAVGTHSELLRTDERYRFVLSSIEEEQRTRAELATDSIPVIVPDEQQLTGSIPLPPGRGRTEEGLS